MISRLRAWLLGTAGAATAPVADAPATPAKAGMKIRPEAPALVAGAPDENSDIHNFQLTPLTEMPRVNGNPFVAYRPPPWITLKPIVNGSELAFDESPEGSIAWNQADPWADTLSGGLTNFGEGIGFFGYAYLSQLAQRPEYRKITETLATEMTREWVEFEYQGDEGNEESATDKIKQIEEQWDKWKLQDVFRHCLELDGFFGRGQIYIDLGTDDDYDEDATVLVLDRRKVKKKGCRGFKVIEPLWSYPNEYDTINPMRKDFYKPRSWLIMNKKIHASRLFTIIGRPVPDILKPAYSFGGLSMSQMAKPYVDNWLRTRQSVSDLIHAFTVWGIKTDLSSVLLGGDAEQLKIRAQLFNQCRDNRGLMMVQNGKEGEGEDFFNISVPLGTLDHLQAQAQEQMASISGIPLVKLLGTTPSGLNASSDGEIRVFYDTINANQERLLRAPLETALKITQLHLFGEIDDNITFHFKELWQQDESEQAVARKTDADVDVNYINAGVLTPLEVRKKLASDKDSPYASIDVNAVPSSDLGLASGGETEMFPGATPGGATGEMFPGAEPDGKFPDASSEKFPQSFSKPGEIDTVKAEGSGGKGSQGKSTEGSATFGKSSKSFAHDADFNEADHPRDEDGKFTSGASSESGKKPDNKPSTLTKGEGKSSRVLGETKTYISPSKFAANKYCKQFDNPSITPRDILKNFPPDTEGKMNVVIDKLHNVAPTNVTHKVNGEWTPHRRELHDTIINRVLSQENIERAKPKSGEPVYTLLGGRGGSGKSKLNGLVYDPDSAIVLDSDEIKQMLPEYEGWNAAQLHEEAGEIFDRITAICVQLGVNLVHDATMKSPDKAVNLVKQFKANGYRVEAHYMFLPRQEAAKRAVSRFLGPTNRLVPPEIILANTENETSFDRVKDLCDAWTFHSNMVGPNDPPKLISKSNNAQIQSLKAQTGPGESNKTSKSVVNEPVQRFAKQKASAIVSHFKDKWGMSIDHNTDTYTKLGEPFHQSVDLEGEHGERAKQGLGYVDAAMDHLQTRGFKVKDVLAKHPVMYEVGVPTSGASGQSWQHEGVGHFNIDYEQATDPEWAAQDDKLTDEFKKENNGQVFSISSDQKGVDKFVTTVIHEMAHALGMQGDAASPRELVQLLNEDFDDEDKVFDWAQSNISHYGASSILELDAELAAKVLSPTYVKGTLPQKYEDHVEKLFSGGFANA